MSICTVCGREHNQTSGCSGGSPVFRDAPPVTVTRNHLTFGEQEILNKLETIIIELQNLGIIIGRK